jgi:hypothetical protein
VHELLCIPSTTNPRGLKFFTPEEIEWLKINWLPEFYELHGKRRGTLDESEHETKNRRGRGIVELGCLMELLFCVPL